jgi:DNA-directed RNA polymerase specialized sigma24 family protein
MADVTQILSQIESGDPSAAEQLLPLVYEELRKLAAAKLAQEKPGQTLQATSLVHEAMRRILIMNARRRCAEKRGGGRGQIELDPSLLPDAERDERLVALDEALTRLEQLHPEKARVVKLRFFAGLTIADAAAAMGISDTTADRYWAYARAWIQREVAAADGSRSN